MFFSTRSYYGTRAMLELARLAGHGPVHLETVARNQKIPERYLAKIVQDLRRGGLIRSMRGAHGGYMLAKQPSSIEMLEIVACLEGSLAPVDCVEFPQVCENAARCVTRGVWQDMHKAVVKVLKSTTLQDLLDRLERNRPALHKAARARRKA